MPNPVLTRLCEQRDQQVDFVNQMLERVDADDRDLVDAERANLKAARERVGELNTQIDMLEEFDGMVETHSASVSRLSAPRMERAQRPLGEPTAAEYRTAGAFIVDHLRARGIPDGRGGRAPSDADAMGRVTRAVANQTTSDTLGLLPVPIVGQVVNIIDASRPLITSLGGAKAMGGIPGKTFQRPKITQHVTVGKQGAEKTELPTQKMTITPLNFSKETYGGTVDISRQDIDWTSPAAWDILVNDLADIYGVQTETAAAADFVAGIVTNTEAAAGKALQDWATALYNAAAKCYAGGKRLPDRVWVSVDMWALMGAVVDLARLAFPPGTDGPSSIVPGAAGESDLADFGGYVFQLPRIVVPTMPAGTIVVGSSSLYEVYEETIGLLSVVEPSILGVTVAYGGYVAFGTLAEQGFCKVTPFPGP